MRAFNTVSIKKQSAQLADGSSDGEKEGVPAAATLE